jgi:hypothetical protein
MAGNATIASRPAKADRYLVDICKLIGSSLWSARIFGKSFSRSSCKKTILVPSMRWEKLFSRHRRTISAGAQPAWSDIAHSLQMHCASPGTSGETGELADVKSSFTGSQTLHFHAGNKLLGAQLHDHAAWAIDAMPRVPTC